MYEGKLYLGRGVGRSLFVAFFVVSLFAFGSAIVGWVGLGFVRDAENEVLEGVYPAARDAQQIALEATAFVLGLPTLLNASTVKELERHKAALVRQEKIVFDLLAKKRKQNYSQDIVMILDPDIRKLSHDFNSLTQLSQEIIELEDQLHKERIVLINLTDNVIDQSEAELVKYGDDVVRTSQKFRNAIKNGRITDANNTFEKFFFEDWKIIQEIYEIKFRAKKIKGQFLGIQDISRKNRLRELQNSMIPDLRTLIKLLVEIRVNDVQTDFAKSASGLSKSISRSNNIFVLKEKIIVNNNKTETIRKSAENTGVVVRNSVTQFVSDIQHEMESKTASTQETTSNTRITLIFFAVFTVISSIAIYVVYINNNLICRLQRLYAATRDINNGVLSKAVKISKDDQITDLEKAIESFRINSLQLQETEKQLKVHTQSLERSNRDLEQFAYVTSHDLRAPLRGITSLAKWIEEDLVAGNMEEVTENLARMRSRVTRMDSLLSGILQYSRAGHEKEQGLSLEVKPIIRDIFDDLNDENRFSLEIISDIDSIVVKEAFFMQIVGNLISNAIKHHNKDKGAIVISLLKTGSNYELRVSDDGPGIPEQMRERMFKIFQTLKPKDKLETSGIGLSLVKRLVDQQKGSVEIFSSKAGGAEFVVTWPCEM